MTLSQSYARYIDSLALNHFSGSEVTRLFRNLRSGVRNSPPPRSLWSNIVPMLVLLNNFRQGIGKSIVLYSTYRSPEYNRAVGGARKSQHLKNSAIDFASPHISPQAIYNRLLKIRTAQGFRGGLKKYSTFVHIDNRGINANW